MKYITHPYSPHTSASRLAPTSTKRKTDVLPSRLSATVPCGSSSPYTASASLAHDEAMFRYSPEAPGGFETVPKASGLKSPLITCDSALHLTPTGSTIPWLAASPFLTYRVSESHSLNYRVSESHSPLHPDSLTT